MVYLNHQKINLKIMSNDEELIKNVNLQRIVATILDDMIIVRPIPNRQI